MYFYKLIIKMKYGLTKNIMIGIEIILNIFDNIMLQIRTKSAKWNIRELYTQ